MTMLRRVMDSSAVVQRARRLAADSIICRAVAALARWPAVTRWLRQTRQRIVVGLGGEWSKEQEIRTVAQLDALVSTSRLAQALKSLVTVPLAAGRHSSVRRWLEPLRSMDLPTRVQTGSWAIIVAVLCHTVLFFVLGVSVHALGWSMRLGLLAAGAIGLRWTDAVVAAWRDRWPRGPS